MSSFVGDLVASGKFLLLAALVLVLLIFPLNQLFPWIEIDFLTNKSLLVYMFEYTEFWLSIFPFFMLTVLVMVLWKQYRR